MSGLGVGILQRLIVEQRSVNYVVRAEPQTEWHLAMIWRRDAYLSNAAKVWLALVRDVNHMNPKPDEPEPKRM
jgi:DNA-binding transcriptional LysR family regulator